MGDIHHPSSIEMARKINRPRFDHILGQKCTRKIHFNRNRPYCLVVFSMNGLAEHGRMFRAQISLSAIYPTSLLRLLCTKDEAVAT